MTAPPGLLVVSSLGPGGAVPRTPSDELVRLLPHGPAERTPWRAPEVCLWPATVHGELVVSFAGRLDGPHREGPPEAHVAAAYRRAGDDAARQLLGEYAFVLYDTVRRRLLVCRDPMASRPLFWWSDATTFLAASDLATVLRWPAVPRRANEGALAELVAGAPATIEETLWEGVFRLPGGHRLSVGAGGVVRTRFWEPSDLSVPAPRSFEEMQEVTRQTVEDAVEDRLAGHTHVGADLSGGLDSSTLIGVAHHLRERGRAPWRDLTTFTAAVSGEAEDPSFIRAVAERWDLSPTVTPPTPLPRDALLEDAAGHRDVPDLLPGWRRMYRDAPAPPEVVLAGHGGDEFLRGTGTLLPGLAVERRFSELKDALAGRATPPAGGAWRGVLHPLLVAYLPAPLRRSTWRRSLPVDWMRADFADRTHLRDRLAPRRPPLRTTPSQRAYIELFDDPWPTMVAESHDRLGLGASLTISNPLWDRRLVSLAWSTPDRLRHRPGRPGALHRGAFGDLLPPAVRDRRSKADASMLLSEQWRAAGAREALATSPLAAIGAIDADRAVLRFDEFTHALGQGTWLPNLLWPLTLTITADTWFRANRP